MTQYIDQARAEAEAKWGWFRNYIKRNPLTGFWVGVGVGIVIGWFAHVVI